MKELKNASYCYSDISNVTAVLSGVWVFGCLGVWVFGCLGVWVKKETLQGI
ncbi:MAG: hypothetical protein AB8B73_16200 [Ekhidna sp.]